MERLDAQVSADDLAKFHVIYTDDDGGMKETYIEAAGFASAEKLFNELFPSAGYYEIGTPFRIQVIP
jgi:hypothetical protein